MNKQILTYSDFNLHTRNGNKNFSLAFLYGCEKKYNREIILPDYFLWKYLKHPPKIDNSLKGEVVFHTRHDGFDPVYVDEFFEVNKDKSIEINLSPNYQTERWWEHCKDYVLERFEFKEEELNKIKQQYSEHLSKKTIGISLRLGTDFTEDKGFFQLPYSFYTDCLDKYFPTWKTDYNVVIFSDNIEEAKTIFNGYGFYYAEPNNTYIKIYDENNYHSPKAVNHLMLGSLMDNFIIGNSTFSWWVAYLSQHRKGNKEGKVICCGRNLDNHYLERTKNDYDYYPQNWIKYEAN